MKFHDKISLKAVDNIAISDIIITVNDIFLLEPNAKSENDWSDIGLGIVLS